MPARIDSSVVLPAPFGPITPTSSPAEAHSDTPRSATRSPYRLTTSRASRTAAVASACMPRDDTRHNASRMRLLFVGDIVGSPGRHAVESLLPGLVERHEPDFVVVNG